jgi:hypothetical protein
MGRDTTRRQLFWKGLWFCLSSLFLGLWCLFTDRCAYGLIHTHQVPVQLQDLPFQVQYAARRFQHALNSRRTYLRCGGTPCL